MKNPPVWSEDELDGARQRAEDHFRESRHTEPLEVMVETVDLTRLEECALDMMSDKRKREVFRYLSGPPVSEDDLKVLMQARSLAPKTLRTDPELLARVVAFMRDWHDRRRFPWVTDEWEPQEHDRNAAILATTALLAMRRVETLRRHEGKKIQERRVEQQLISNDSPFDRYLAGERWALTSQQRRGMALFRSGQTNCSRCHVPPTFTEPAFRRVAVPDLDGGFSDPGRMLATEYIADEFAFKVPTLRNIALTAPYMHNGRFESLEAVIDFYAQGGGPGLVENAPQTDVWVRGFEISAEEIADLVAFLYALTDESALPPIPEAVPSGLPPEVAIENPVRAIVAAGIAPAIADSSSRREPSTLVVAQGQSIQAAIDRAIPGDSIEIEYGTYSEELIVDLNDITLRGLPNAAGEWPLLDGRNELNEAILASGDNFTVEQLHITDYVYNGAIVQGAENVTFRDLDVSGTFQGYGLYALQNSAALFERVNVSGAHGAGIYAGQSDGVIVRNSTVHANVVGIELENSVNVEVYGSLVFDNTTGVFIAMLPYLNSKASDNTELHDNVIEANNRLNFNGTEGGAGFAPSGSGVLVLAGDDVRVHGNVIRENDSFGVGVFGTASGLRTDVQEYDQTAEGVRVFDNDVDANGNNPDLSMNELGLRGADLVWDARNWDTAWRVPGVISDPALLPGISWPDFLRRAYWRLLTLTKVPGI